MRWRVKENTKEKYGLIMGFWAHSGKAEPWEFYLMLLASCIPASYVQLPIRHPSFTHPSILVY